MHSFKSHKENHITTYTYTNKYRYWASTYIQVANLDPFNQSSVLIENYQEHLLDAESEVWRKTHNRWEYESELDAQDRKWHYHTVIYKVINCSSLYRNYSHGPHQNGSPPGGHPPKTTYSPILWSQNQDLELSSLPSWSKSCCGSVGRSPGAQHLIKNITQPNKHSFHWLRISIHFHGGGCHWLCSLSLWKFIRIGISGWQCLLLTEPDPLWIIFRIGYARNLYRTRFPKSSSSCASKQLAFIANGWIYLNIHGLDSIGKLF